MPTNSFNIGRDCQVVLISPLDGSVVDLQLVTGFEADQETHLAGSNPLNGPPIEQHLPKGWRGHFTVDRGNKVVDTLIAAIEQQYWAGQTAGPGMIYQYIAETDQSTTIWQYSGVTIKLSKGGTWTADQVVKQTLEFFASLRTRIN